MYTFLLVLLILDAFVLIAAILLQAGKGGGLAASFGGASSSPDAFVGIRQAGTILTKATWWCGGIFMVLAFALQIMSTRTRAPRSVLEGTFAQPTAPAPATGAPIVPLEPAPGTQPPPAAAGQQALPPAAPPAQP